MRNNIPLILILFFIVCVCQTKAQEIKLPNSSFTLKEAVEYAQKHQVAILNAQIDEVIAKNKVKQNIASGLPQINANYSFQNFINIPVMPVPGIFAGKAADVIIPVKFGTKYQSNVGLEITQLLFDGSYFVGVKAAEAYQALSTRNLKRSRIETTVAVMKAYYSALVNNERLALLDVNLRRLKKTLSDTELMLKNGLAEKIDVQRLQVLNNNLEAERENVLHLLTLNMNLLKFQMGMPIPDKLELKDSISSFLLKPITPVLLDTLAYSNRIEYNLLETRLTLSKLNSKLYKSKYYPLLATFLSAGGTSMSDHLSSLFNAFYPTTVCGVKISIPIFSSGQRLHQLSNANLEVVKSTNEMNLLKNSITLEVEQSQTQYLNGEKALENQKRNIKLAEEILRISRIKYSEGVGSNLEVISAETSLKEAQNNYLNALYDILISKVNLDKALGKLNYE